jgi:hypothetical protein
MTTVIDMTTRIARGQQRGDRPITNSLPRRSFWMEGDDLLYLTSTGEWARVQEDEEGRAAGLLLAPAGPRCTIHPHPLFTSAEEVLALVGNGKNSMTAKDLVEELRHHDDLRRCAHDFEAAPSGSWAVVLGTTSEWSSCLAVGESPAQASDNAVAAEEESDPDLDADTMHAGWLARGHLVVRPCTRRFLSAFRLDPSTVAHLDDRGYVDLCPAAIDVWTPEIN